MAGSQFRPREEHERYRYAAYALYRSTGEAVMICDRINALLCGDQGEPEPGQGLGREKEVCGDAPELGGWVLARFPRLEYINGDAWFAEMGFESSAGRPICFQGVVLCPDGAGPVDESLICGAFLQPLPGALKPALNWTGVISAQHIRKRPRGWSRNTCSSRSRRHGRWTGGPAVRA